jgi:hypothetical protein
MLLSNGSLGANYSVTDMTDSKKPIQIEFAPGCFDMFEGTQEELDALQKEILDMFANMTPEELAERSTPVNLNEMLDGATEDEVNHVLSALSEETKRNLH